MPVVLAVEFALPLVLEIHVSGIPIALLGLALRTPMGPEAELGVLKPLGRLILA